MKDLIVLVADKNMEFAINSLLRRTHSLRIREVSYDIKVHSHRDPGIYNTAHDFLRIFTKTYSHSIVMLDKEGCGCQKDSICIAGDIQLKLDNSGWINRSKVIVLDPELEIWIWSESPEVASCMGWNNNELRDWLFSNGLLLKDATKPRNPKYAFEEALRLKMKPRSSSIYGKLADKVSLERCTDSSFLAFKNSLQAWFPILQDEN